jgi:hypothetical protein
MASLPLDAFLDRAALDDVFDIPPSVIEGARDIAQRFYLEGRHRDAEVVCRALLAVNPRCPWARALYAATLRALGNPELAAAWSQPVAALSPICRDDARGVA